MIRLKKFNLIRWFGFVQKLSYLLLRFIIRAFLTFVNRWVVEFAQEENREHFFGEGDSVLVVINHVHRLDYFVVAAALPFIASPIMSYDVIRGHKKLSSIVRLVGCFCSDAMVVYRHGESSNTAAMYKAIKRLRQGSKLLIAPEGMRSKTGHLAPLKPGAAFLALSTNTPILPIVTYGYKDWKGWFTSPIHVVIGDLIVPPTYELGISRDSQINNFSEVIELELQRLLTAATTI